ncbi:MAG: hypothetical protein U9O83_00420, partial [Campylobacterota bacterium]|nr:hypothetical protein [Campylobacterota bacterium]
MNLEQFLQLFNPLPGNHYMQVATAHNEITDALNLIVEDVDGELDVILYNSENLDFSQPFRALARSNDIIILQDIFA